MLRKVGQKLRAIHSRHLHVNYREIRMELLDQSDALCSFRCLRDTAYILPYAFNLLDSAFSNQAFVIDYDICIHKHPPFLQAAAIT